jgi:hypothetical protein
MKRANLNSRFRQHRRRYRALFPGAEIRAERFAGLTKSLIAVHR